MTNQQQLWIKAQYELYGVSYLGVVRFGVWLVNQDGDLLHTFGEGDFRRTPSPQYSYCLAEFSNDYLDAKQGLMEEYQDMVWWKPSDAETFELAFCLAWHRAKEMNHEDPGFKKDFERLQPELHIDEVLSDTERDSKDDGYDWLEQEEDFHNIPAYRYALKVTNLQNFIETFSWIGYEEQHHAFEMLADLEQQICKDWNQHHKIRNTYYIDYLGDKMVIFEFSSFSLKFDDFDAEYNCVCAHYTYTGTIKL